MLRKDPGGASTPMGDVADIAPEHRLLVIGDIHGSERLLDQKLKDVDAYVSEQLHPDEAVPIVVFVGDYIDRGEQSAAVLQWLFELEQDLPDNVVCLMGNHERMMLDFLDDPAGRGVRWLRNGGLQTLSSYNIGGVRERSSAEELVDASEALEEALPEGLLEWLRRLPLIYRTGNVCVVHAAMDPHLGPDDQSSQALLWGHRDFLTTTRRDGLWVVHGHTIVPEPEIRKSRISIDTGAYHSGRLTAAAIEPGKCTFI